MPIDDNNSDDEERRSGRDRRHDEAPSDWSEKRAGVERRGENDRRGIYYSVRYTNPEAIEKLREWLQEHCTGAFELGLPDDLSELGKWGKYRVKFELKEDRTKLARLIGVHWQKWLG